LNGQSASFYLDRANHTGALPSAALNGSYALALNLSNPANNLAGSGVAITALNASNVSSGTIGDARLSANIPLKNAANTFSAVNTFSNSGNSFAGNGAGLTNLSASALSSGTLNDVLLTGNVAMRNAPNVFTGTLLFNGSAQTPLDVLSANTGGTWMTLRNSSLNARSFNLLATGSGNSEGAGKLLVRDATVGAIRMSFDSDGDVGIGTATPAAPLDVQVAGGQTLQFRQDGGLVPGINVNSSGGLAGIMRLRNALEVWPSDNGLRAGKLDIRNAAGNPTISMDGSSGNIVASNLPSLGFKSERNHYVFQSGSDSTTTIVDLTVNVPAAGVLLIEGRVYGLILPNLGVDGRAKGALELKMDEAALDGSSTANLAKTLPDQSTSTTEASVLTTQMVTAAGQKRYQLILYRQDGSSSRLDQELLIVHFYPSAMNAN
jgi:hypothetical protein